MSKKSWTSRIPWFEIASIFVLGALAYLLLKGNPFCTKQVARGKVKRASSGNGDRGISEKALLALIDSGDKFAVGVMSDSCGHCQSFKPDFFKAKKEIGSKLKYFDATESKNSRLFEKLDVQGFPSIVYMDKSKPVGQYSGNRKANDVVKKVKQFLN